MKPIIQIPGTYLGGKNAAGVVHNIINQIPAHETFVSGFLGFCAVLRYKRPAARSIGIELDPAVVAAWRKAKQPITMSLAIRETDFFKHYSDLPLYDPETFLYLDPPYPHSTRKSNHRYNHELSDEQHAELLAIANRINCKVAISTYDNPLYQSALSSWRKISFTAQTRGSKPATETLYMNYPEPSPAQLHDARFTGDGFRDREKSKRRIDTILRKIDRLEPHEYARLLTELQNRNVIPGEL